jgi:GAF domain-containing protein
MSTDRVLREIAKRLSGLAEDERLAILAVVRQELGRVSSSLAPGLKVESERTRRKEAETLREVLEAILRQSRLRETIDEVLKQLARVVSFDTCSLAVAEPDGRLRIVGARGFNDPAPILGLFFSDALSDAIREERVAVSLADVSHDDRFAKIAGTEDIRSWAGIPLLVEGEVVGLLSLDRHQLLPFDDDEMHRAKLVAFSAAAAIRNAQLLEQVRRYATVMERVVAVDQAVFAGGGPAEVLQAVLEGALHVGTHAGGLLLLAPDARVAVARGDALADAEGRLAPKAMLVRSARRFETQGAAEEFAAAGLPAPGAPLYVVPFASSEAYVGSLVLLDPDGETPDDRLMESYASRAAAAYLHAARRRPGSP